MAYGIMNCFKRKERYTAQVNIIKEEDLIAYYKNFWYSTMINFQ